MHEFSFESSIFSLEKRFTLYEYASRTGFFFRQTTKLCHIPIHGIGLDLAYNGGSYGEYNI